ncbi:MAG TPA: hypothetical protein V6C63_20665 [Allocoleopsis sp.]
MIATSVQIADGYSARLLAMPKQEQSSLLKDNGGTVLEQVISNLPWQDAFTLGCGVDVVTGTSTGSALKHFEPNSNTVKQFTENYRFIQSDEQMNREIEASASGKYNVQGVVINGSAAYLSKVEYSEVSTTLIAEYGSQDVQYAEAETYELTDEAKSLLGNPSEFRKRYGDYFISGVRRGSRFIATYTCKANSVQQMDEFKASFGAEAPEVFSAEGSTRFMQAVSQSSISLTVNVDAEGYQGVVPSGPWTPEKVLEALEWFKKNEQGSPLRAKLTHYSTIAPQYPQSVDISPDIFVSLRQLYTKLWDVRSRYDSCPQNYQDQLKQEYTAFDYGVVANQNILATDSTKLLDYQQKADDLLSKLTDIVARMDFYTKLKNVVPTEPGNGQEIKEGSGQQTWAYGYSTYTKSDAVVIHSTQLNYKASGHVGHRGNTFEFGPNGNYLIVGWQVVSNWNDGTNGSWWKGTDQIILGSYACVRVRSKYDRGCDWSLIIYYVDAKDYQF